MDIQTLQKRFSHIRQISFNHNPGQHPTVLIKNNHATAVISMYAAHILSYQRNNDQQDLFYLSQQAIYMPGKAIRGGIPVCWPWFGDTPESNNNPAHGFARSNFWDLIDVEQIDSGSTRIHFQLKEFEQSLKLWPKSFKLDYFITVSDELKLELKTSNCGQQGFSISEALHSYFNISNINDVIVQGLKNHSYLDKMEQYLTKEQLTELKINVATDRIYDCSEKTVYIEDPGFNRRIIIHSQGNRHIVAWNPWKQGASNLKDMPDDDYLNFICLETANALANTMTIPAGQSHSIACSYQIEPL